MFKVSNSKMKTWQRCKYSYHLKYNEKLVRKVKPGPLQRGSIIHECLEAYHNGKSWKKPLKEFTAEFNKSTFAEERVELGDIPGMVNELLENYFYYYEDEEFEHLQNEMEFEWPLTKDIIITGFIDAIVKDSDGRVWVKEYKTFARSPDREFLMFNNQASIYSWVAAKFGYKVDGMIWDIIKAKTPSKPKMTEKTQKLSVAKLDSTPYTVIKGIKELGLDPAEYEEFIAKHSFEDYFLRHKVRLNNNVVEQIMEDTKVIAKDILQNGTTRKEKNLGKDCSWCSYKSICQAELLGLDTSYIINAEYQIREERDEKGKKGKKGKPHRG